MEQYDDQMARRVWQRVQGDVPPAPPAREEDAVLALLAGELAAAAAYTQLARRWEGKEAALLRTLAEEERAHAACLRGILFLLTGRRPKLTAPVPLREPAEVALRRCYAQTLQAAREYEARTASREFGPAFIQLAQEEKAHCQQLLTLLGRG